MSEKSDLRYDPVADKWVAIARNRLQRPTEFVPNEQIQKHLLCPFCQGNEDATPASIVIYQDDFSALCTPSDTETWSTRIVPNKYPALTGQQLFEANAANLESGLQRHCSTQGVQELVIPSSRHVTSLSQLTDNELAVSLFAAAERIVEIREMPTTRHVMFFMNCRASAGASLAHLHWQLIATPVLSSDLILRADRNVKHWQETGETIVVTSAKWESDVNVRLVDESDQFWVFCPFASRFPMQARIVPKHVSSFSDVSREQLMELSRHLKMIIARYEKLLDSPAYNILLHIPPFAAHDAQAAEPGMPDNYYFEVFPRLAYAAGLEMGTDIWVNPVAPESAAKALRRQD